MNQDSNWFIKGIASNLAAWMIIAGLGAAGGIVGYSYAIIENKELRGQSEEFAQLQQESSGEGGLVEELKSVDANEYYNTPLLNWSHYAAELHRFYSEHEFSVEVIASDTDKYKLQEYLRSNTIRGLEIPDLRIFGLSLLGGRVHPMRKETIAQIMYEDREGLIYSLFGIKDHRKGPLIPEKVEQLGDLNALEWMIRGNGYVVMGWTGPGTKINQVALAVFDAQKQGK